MQQKRSVTFDDWKEAFRMGFDGFILGCGEATAQGYIERFSDLAEVKGLPVFRSDGVHVNFKKPQVVAPETVKGFPSSRLLAGIILGFCLISLLTTIVLSIDPPSKTVTVQEHIIPRECFITHAKTEVGWYMYIRDMNSTYEIYIEVDDYKEFLKEYLEQ